MATQYVIKRGDLGIGVNKLQAYLNMMQQRNLISTVNKQDGVFGPLTETAVREWQRYAGLPIYPAVNKDFPYLKCKNTSMKLQPPINVCVRFR